MATRVKNIWDKAVTLENIEAAIHTAAKGKRARRDVQYALAHSAEVAKIIYDDLQRGDWRFPEVRKAKPILDGIRKKSREIVEPSFREQIIHHVYIDYMIMPVFMPTFYRWTCGSIPRRGQEEMAKYILRMVSAKGAKVKWCCQLDIRKCFDTIDTGAIYAAVARRIGDKRVLEMTLAILDANAVSHPSGLVTKRGIPIGLYTSPWFANIALSPLDHYAKDKMAIYLYVRYIDDLLIMHGNKRELKRAIDGMSAIIGALSMEWKRAPQIREWWKVRFTGFHLTRTALQVHDSVFIRARRAGARTRRKAMRRRITAFDAEKLISYSGRFRSFGGYNAFVTQVLKGGISMRAMRQKVSARSRFRNLAIPEKEVA